VEVFWQFSLCHTLPFKADPFPAALKVPVEPVKWQVNLPVLEISSFQYCSPVMPLRTRS
jgi:hypothetical protein